MARGLAWILRCHFFTSLEACELGFHLCISNKPPEISQKQQNLISDLICLYSSRLGVMEEYFFYFFCIILFFQERVVESIPRQSVIDIFTY